MIITEEKKITLKIELCTEDEKNIKKLFIYLIQQMIQFNNMMT